MEKFQVKNHKVSAEGNCTGSKSIINWCKFRWKYQNIHEYTFANEYDLKLVDFIHNKLCKLLSSNGNRRRDRLVRL